MNKKNKFIKFLMLVIFIVGIIIFSQNGNISSITAVGQNISMQTAQPISYEIKTDNNRVESTMLKNNTPFYEVTEDDITLKFYYIDENLYLEYIENDVETVAISLYKQTNYSILNYYTTYLIENDTDKIIMSTYKYDSVDIIVDNLQYKYSIGNYTYYNDFNGEIASLKNLPTIISDDLKNSIAINPLDKYKGIINANIPKITLEISENQPFGVVEITIIEPIIPVIKDAWFERFGLRLTMRVSDELNKSYLERGLGSDKLCETYFDFVLTSPDVSTQVLDGETIIYLNLNSHMEIVFEKYENDIFYFHILIFNGEQYVRCSNVIIVTREQYEQKIW